MHSLRAASEKRDLGGVRRVVVKVGSAVIAGKGRLRPKILSIVARDVTALQNRGCEVVMVVSGAVAAGYRPLGMHQMPTVVVERQSAASVGQHLLMATISTLFEKHRGGTERQVDSRLAGGVVRRPRSTSPTSSSPWVV